MASESFLDRTDTLSPGDISKRCDTIIGHFQTSYPRFDLEYFRGKGMYTHTSIDQDLALLEKIKKDFTQKNSSYPKSDQEKMAHSRKRSEALEIIIADQIETSDWFGDTALLFRTTEYDDYVNGVDAVVEFDQPDGDHRIALAVDSTSKTELQTLVPKIDRNISKILTNRCGVRYYESPRLDNPYIGPLVDIIPVVVGLEAHHTNDLVTSFARLLDLERSSQDPNTSSNLKVILRNEFHQLRRKIEKDPTQIIFLEEIKSQLEMYRSILNRENNPQIHISTHKLDGIIEIVNGIITSKEPIKVDLESKIPQGDAVFNLIKYSSQKKQKSF